MGGRITPDVEAKGSSSRSSIRSPSVHSVRVIDVASPKSPTGSRHSSVGPADYAPSGRPILISSPHSSHSPVLSDVHAPRLGSPISRGPTSSPVTKIPTSMGPRSHRNSVGNSISEVEEETKKQDAELDQNGPIIPVHSAAVVPSLPGVDLRASQDQDFAVKKPVTLDPETFDKPKSLRAVSNQQNSAPNLTILVQKPTNGVKGAVPVTPTSPTMRSHLVNGRRVSPPPPAKDTSPKAQRSIHTSGSGSSTTSHKLKPVRTSEESSSNGENKSQSFEQLIQSDQTIQYTLTPQNMRDIEAPESPRSPRNNSFGGGISPIDGRPLTGRSHSSSLGKFVGLSSNPPNSPKATKSPKPFKAVARPPSNTGSRLRPNAPQPRDARVDRDSIGDFAEFIRSTGALITFNSILPKLTFLRSRQCIRTNSAQDSFYAEIRQWQHSRCQRCRHAVWGPCISKTYSFICRPSQVTSTRCYSLTWRQHQ